MRYQPPFKYGDVPAVPGIHNADANASYINGNPAIGDEGSFIPCEGVEHTQRELVKLFESSGIVQDHTNLQQVAEAAARYASGGVYAIDTGAANAYVLALSGNFVKPTAYFDGLEVQFDPLNVNTTSATAAAFGLAAKPIVKVDGSALTGGEIRAPTVLRYSVISGGRWVLMPWSGLQFQLESCRYRLPGNNTNVVQTFTVMPFSVGTLPSFATLSGGIFTLTRAGTYLCTGILMSDWTSNFSLNLLHNGSYAFATNGSSGGSGASISATATLYKAAKGDTIQAWSWFNTGGIGTPTVLQTRVISPLTAHSEITITRIAD